MKKDSSKKNVGVLLINLGTPDAPTPKAVRRYLAQFLSDRRVVNLPSYVWQPFLHGIILKRRSQASAKLYEKIWLDQGSPLMVISHTIAEKLQAHLQESMEANFSIALGMRYGATPIAFALQELNNMGIEKIIILPLYPQYSSSTTGSAFDVVANLLSATTYIPELKFINHYAQEKSYLEAITKSIDQYWQQYGRGEKLLFSFHGLPQKSVKEGDPYFFHCENTVKCIVEKLNLNAPDWQMVFQSRFGWQKWLQPYCDKTLIQLAQQGYKNIDIVCPGFAVDCLETLEEIAIRNQEIFKAHGGQRLNYIPALNDSEAHIQVLADIVMKNL